MHKGHGQVQKGHQVQKGREVQKGQRMLQLYFGCWFHEYNSMWDTFYLEAGGGPSTERHSCSSCVQCSTSVIYFHLPVLKLSHYEEMKNLSCEIISD